MSLGIGSSYTPPPSLEAAYENGSYVFNGKSISEAELNAQFEANAIPLVARSGDFYTTEGLRVSTNGAEIDFGGATPLPDVPGTGASIEDLGNKLGWLGEIGDGALMWAALSEMARGAMREMKDARDLKNAMFQGKIQAKTAQINATEKQIAAERKAAAETLAWSIAAAVVTAAISALNVGGSSTAAGAIGAAVSPVITNLGNYISKTGGAQREADEQRLVGKRYEREEALFDDSIDSAKSSYEESKELFKLALRILTEHSERQTQVLQKITS